MDLMKVIDQAVREIKREVNIKVLKVPEIEQKVLDATSDEPWGPHGSALAEIAQATKKFTECQMIMNVLWTRLTETDRNWRYVYKALAVIEYLVANGSERAVDDILEHTFQISSLSGFEFVEPSGKDMGINVRKKVETLMALLRDKDKIQQTREKAAANRDKYLGLSSTGITYKPSSASYGSGNFQQTGLSSARESEMFKTSYRERARYGEETDRDQGKGYAFSKDYRGKSRSQRDTGNGNKGNDSKKGPAHDNRDQDDNYGPIASSQSSNAQPISNDDDFDDFDPRGSSTAGSGAAGINKVDLFGESLIIDLIDAPASVPTERTSLNDNASSDADLFADATFVSASPHTETQGSSFSNGSTKVDLFADAAFVSALPHAETQGSSHTQASVDLFANPSFPAGSSSMVDFFTEPSPILPTETDSSKSEPTKPNTIDPFAAVPLSKFEESDLFGAFTSHTDSPSTSTTEGLNNPIHKTVAESKPPPKKDTFQVKSGIWADSLSRGLIDLNITASKKTSLADVGIVGLDDGSDEKARGLPASGYMGRTMGVGSGLGLSGFNSSTTGSDRSFSNFNQNQFGNFK